MVAEGGRFARNEEGMAEDKQEIRINTGGEAAEAAEEVKTAKDEQGATELSLSEAELEALCREHVCPACDVMKEAEDRYLRGLADTENLKKRLTREAEESRKYLSESLLSDMLPVLDNLDLALSHAEGTEGCETIVTGVDMTRKLFLETLERHGLSAVGEVGEEFNPEFHEALGVLPADDGDENLIGRLVQRGFLLKGRLLRPAKVMVTKK